MVISCLYVQTVTRQCFCFPNSQWGVTAHDSTNEIVLNQAAQGPSSDSSKKTESAPLSLLKLCVSPTPKIVNRLSKIKKKNTRGPCKRLTRKTPKDLTADPPL